MATIKDVARLAGVSTTTVSHVINKTRFVAENTTKKVWSAVEELNYSPSFVARSLKCNSTRTIGLLITQSTNPFFAKVIQGAEQYCYSQGYTLMLCNTEGSQTKQQEYLRRLLEKRVDGLLIMCSDLDASFLAQLNKQSDLPIVVMDWNDEHINTDKIYDNAKHGGYQATKYLIENGHIDIACITGALDKITCQQRLAGYRQALEEANIIENPNWILEGDFEAASGVNATKSILALPKRPSAIFCFNDNMALATISTLQQAGLSVPNDISVIGYDNIDIAAYFSPPLTSVDQPKAYLGKKAVELLLKRINDNQTERQIFDLTPKLVIRKSVKDLRLP